MREKLQRFMIGRYGMDELGRFLNAVSLVLLIVSLFVPLLSPLVLALLVLIFFRMFSRNRLKRTQENGAYLRLRHKLKTWFAARVQRMKESKTHRYYRCPSCRQSLRVPKGKGKIAITCPKCRKVFEKRT